jgi:hypothetical protein
VPQARSPETDQRALQRFKCGRDHGRHFATLQVTNLLNCGTSDHYKLALLLITLEKLRREIDDRVDPVDPYLCRIASLLLEDQHIRFVPSRHVHGRCQGLAVLGYADLLRIHNSPVDLLRQLDGPFVQPLRRRDNVAP